MKFLGRCACPDCLIETDQFWKMGTKTYMARRLKRARVDDREYRRRVRSAREFIFEHGFSTISERVNKLLGSRSLIPTCVSVFVSVAAPLLTSGV